MKSCARAKVSLFSADFCGKFAKTCNVLLCAWLAVSWDSSAIQWHGNLTLLQNLASEIKLLWFCLSFHLPLLHSTWSLCNPVLYYSPQPTLWQHLREVWIFSVHLCGMCNAPYLKLSLLFCSCSFQLIEPANKILLVYIPNICYIACVRICA